MQLIIALLGFVAIASAHAYRSYALRKSPLREPELAREDVSLGRYESSVSNPSDCICKPKHQSHPELWLKTLSEFHKAQCYYSIALQIASFVALYGGSDTNRNKLDEVFLLLIGANGLVPIAIVIYTLTLSERTNSYHILLTFISASLASFIGFAAVAHFESTQEVSEGSWPKICGGLSPQYLCDWGMELERYYYPNRFFLAGAVLCNTLIVFVTGWYLTKCFKDHSMFQRFTATYNRSTIVRPLLTTVLHTTAIFILLFGSAAELFFFRQFFSKRFTGVLNEWGFGQIVGITIWSAVIVDLGRHEIGKSKSLINIMKLLDISNP